MARFLSEFAGETGDGPPCTGEVSREVVPVLYREDSAVSRLQLAVEQILFARNYTNRLLDQTPATEWFRQPPGGVSHVAWQVGHLAFAEYRMALERIRGPQPQDADLIAEEFLRLFGRDSVPNADPAHYPGRAEIRAVFDRVHEQTLSELR